VEQQADATHESIDCLVSRQAQRPQASA